MKKITMFVAVMAGVVLAHSAGAETNYAGDPAPGQAGAYVVDAKWVPGTNTFTVTLPVAWIGFSDPGVKGTRTDTDWPTTGKKVWILDYANNPGAFSDMHLSGTQADWAGVDIENRNKDLDLAHEDITGSTVTFTLGDRTSELNARYGTSEGGYCQPIVPVTHLKKGKGYVAGYGPLPGLGTGRNTDKPDGQYIGRTMPVSEAPNGRPHILLYVDSAAKTVGPGGDVCRDLAASREQNQREFFIDII